MRLYSFDESPQIRREDYLIAIILIMFMSISWFGLLLIVVHQNTIDSYLR